MNLIVAAVLFMFVSAPSYTTECSNKYPVWQVCKTTNGGGAAKTVPPAGTPGTPGNPNPPSGDDGDGSEGGPGNGGPGNGHGHGDHGHGHGKK